MFRSIVAALSLCLFTLGASAAGLPTIKLDVAGKTVVAEVATTPDERSVGLMNRFSLQPDHGMVFVFEQPQPLGFWMKNTYIPLSVAFVDAQGTIINIADMQPHSEQTHCSARPALYALEMTRGWFAAKGVKTGDFVNGLPPPAKR